MDAEDDACFGTGVRVSTVRSVTVSVLVSRLVGEVIMPPTYLPRDMSERRPTRHRPGDPEQRHEERCAGGCGDEEGAPEKQRGEDVREEPGPAEG